MRNISDAVLAALDAPTAKLCFLCDLDFQTGPVRMHTWIGGFDGVDPFTAERLLFRGVGGFGSIDGLEQPEELRASGIRLQLSGIDPDTIAIGLDTDYQGRPAKIYLGVVDDADSGLIADELIPLARASMNTITTSIGETATITLSLRNELEDWERPRISRYSDAEQQRLYPGDTFCTRISVAAESTITWKAV